MAAVSVNMLEGAKRRFNMNNEELLKTINLAADELARRKDVNYDVYANVWQAAESLLQMTAEAFDEDEDCYDLDKHNAIERRAAGKGVL